MRKLVIISHTDHQEAPDGTIVGWGPTVNEINHIADKWEEVVHVACFQKGNTKGTSLPYKPKNIKLIPIPTFGGKHVWHKLHTLFIAPLVLYRIYIATKNASEVQIRVPMGIGIFVLPYFFVTRKKRQYTLWVKYANNWIQNNPPIGYRFQRWFLKKNFLDCKVTINGSWPNQQSHCISFENPCLTSLDIDQGKRLVLNKSYTPPFNLAFAGRLEDAKGVSRILNALKIIPSHLVKSVIFIGEGPKAEEYIKRGKELNHQIIFTGPLTQEQVHLELSGSDFLLLPTTASEGFPKVLAEAASFGCIPICTNLASIGQYVEHKETGFVIDENEIDKRFPEFLLECLSEPPEFLRRIAMNSINMAALFTFERYIYRLLKLILNR